MVQSAEVDGVISRVVPSDMGLLPWLRVHLGAKGLVADFLPSSPHMLSGIAGKGSLCGGQETKDDDRLFVGKSGFDDKSAELDFAPGIRPAVEIT